jgi:hypothetical protein
MIVAARRCGAHTVAKRGFAQDNLIHKPRGTIMFIKSDYPGYTEERFLLAELGPDIYGAYCRRVPMLIPFLPHRR